MKKNLIISLTLICSLAISSTSMALKSDRDQPAQIEADNTEIDFRTGVRTLTHNVIVVQGTLRLKADKLVASYDKQGELVKAVADGSLARFKQRPDNQPEDVEGWGKQISIDYPTNTITLIGNAALKQGASTATGNKIVYNMATDKLRIQGDSTFDGAGKNGEAPKRKLEDPFADDAPSASAEKTKTATKKAENTASSNTEQAASETTTETLPEVVEQQVEPAKQGRSRLILQPKKKD